MLTLTITAANALILSINAVVLASYVAVLMYVGLSDKFDRVVFTSLCIINFICIAVGIYTSFNIIR